MGHYQNFYCEGEIWWIIIKKGSLGLGLRSTTLGRNGDSEKNKKSMDH